MDNIFIITLVSVLAVSLVSLVGLFLIPVSTIAGKKVFAFLVSFSAGALLGDVFIHLLPELAEEGELTLRMSSYILGAIVFLFFMEKYMYWHHHHGEGDSQEHAAHPYVYNILFGDFIHNFIDGLIIAGAYQIDFRLGLATTIAVLVHEIPQEIGDFGALVHGGFTKTKALLFNFISGLGAILGAILAFALTGVDEFLPILIALGAGSFIYIATADLIPQLHKQNSRTFTHAMGLLLGIAIMAALLLFE
jgi:zinc and cadmium transporter